MRSIFLTFCMLVGFTVASVAATLTPHLSPKEHRIYNEIMTINPAAARRYLATRNYLSMCRQVNANHKLAINLTYEPDSYDKKYVTKSEQKIVSDAITLNIAAMLSYHRHH